MVRKDVEDLSDEELLEIYKLINDFIKYLEDEMGDNNDKAV